jgi:hypothetical protein
MAFVIKQDSLGGCGTVTVTSVGTTYTFTVDLTVASGLTLHSVGGTPDARWLSREHALFYG